METKNQEKREFIEQEDSIYQHYPSMPRMGPSPDMGFMPAVDYMPEMGWMPDMRFMPDLGPMVPFPCPPMPIGEYAYRMPSHMKRMYYRYMYMAYMYKAEAYKYKMAYYDDWDDDWDCSYSQMNF